VTHVLRCVQDCNTIERDALIFDRIEWDDANLEHATVRVSSAEIEQAIWNARRMFRHRSNATAWSSDREPMAVGRLWSLPNSPAGYVRSQHGRRSDEQIN
jgi:hypothetical protein